jgi:hypothetical protein
MPEAADLPNDVEALKGIILECSTKLEVAEALLISQKLELEKLRFEIAYLKRMKDGRSSEQLDRELVQMQLSIEDLEHVPSHFKVIRHVRANLSCASCQRIVQPLAPSRPIERGIAGPGLLAHVLVAKYRDHLPLYRQSQIYAREGIDVATQHSVTAIQYSCRH